MAFNGKIPVSPGNTLIRLHNRATAPPSNKVTGIRELWFEVPSIKRAICGTANPIKAIGPQKAVVIAVSIPVAINNRLRVSRTFTPRFSAYRFPNNKAFKGLINMTDKTKPAVIETTNTGNCPEDTPLKFPNPQII